MASTPPRRGQFALLSRPSSAPLRRPSPMIGSPKPTPIAASPRKAKASEPVPDLRLFYTLENSPGTNRCTVLCARFPLKDSSHSRSTRLPKAVKSLFGGIGKNFNSDAAALNISLEGDLRTHSGLGKNCHLQISPLLLFAGRITITATDAHLELATHLGVSDPLSLRIEIPAIQKTSQGSLYTTEDRSLTHNRDINKQWFRVRSVEYIKLVDKTNGVVMPFTPERRTTVAEVQHFVASIQKGHVAPWEVELSFEGTVLSKHGLLSTYKLTNKATIDIEFVGVECSACSTKYPGHQENDPIAAGCTHERSTCGACLRGWIAGQLDSVGWNDISCSECDARLEHNDVKKHASPQTFNTYERLATRAALDDIPEFRFCLSPSGCEAGQIHAGGEAEPVFTCHSCNYKFCVICSCPWHADETCSQYADRKAAVSKHEAASEDFVKINTKRCPKCDSKILKHGGCDHMTCRKCSHEFCWLCFADYNDIRTQGNTAHRRDCQYHSRRLRG